MAEVRLRLLASLERPPQRRLLRVGGQKVDNGWSLHRGWSGDRGEYWDCRGVAVGSEELLVKAAPYARGAGA